MTRLSGGPASTYATYFGPGWPKRASVVFCQSSRFCQMNHLPLGSKLFSVYGPSDTGGLNANLSGSPAFSNTCFGIIHIAFQRTVKSAWKRELAFFNLNTTVYGSGAAMLATLTWIGALQRRPLVFRCVSTV